jgi:hypothetical protein
MLVVSMEGLAESLWIKEFTLGGRSVSDGKSGADGKPRSSESNATTGNAGGNETNGCNAESGHSGENSEHALV